MYQSDLCRFDSPDWVGRLLVDSISGPAPERIIDLGSGGGSLAIAALKKWHASEILTVDLDDLAGEQVRKAIGTCFPASVHGHVNADILLASALATEKGMFGTSDLIISNPPYRSTELSSDVAEILSNSGLDLGLKGIRVPTDIVFLAQAISLIRPGGCLGLIVPDLLVTGERWKALRAKLLRHHTVERVIQLPRRCFKGTDAQTYILVVRQGRPSKEVRLDRIDTNGIWEPTVYVSVDRAAERMDHCFHYGINEIASIGGVTLNSLGVTATRGKISSNQLLTAGLPTFHTNGFPCRAGKKIILPAVADIDVRTQGIWAEPGDILVARVDRRLEQKITIVAEGFAALSDCVLRVRCPEAARNRVLKGLISKKGKDQLQARSRGTGARHLSARSLLEVIV